MSVNATRNRIFDPVKRNTFRSDIYPDYKKDRDKKDDEKQKAFRKRSKTNIEIVVQKYKIHNHHQVTGDG